MKMILVVLSLLFLMSLPGNPECWLACNNAQAKCFNEITEPENTPEYYKQVDLCHEKWHKCFAGCPIENL